MKIVLSSLLLLVSTAHAGLIGLDNQTLSEINGQGGADLSWTLSLNHKATTDGSLSRVYECSGDTAYCRLAISPNNRKDGSGNIQWLVFKQLQGTLQLEKFQLDGVSLAQTGDGSRTALQLRFGDDGATTPTYFQPLKIRNFGYAALQIETDSTTQKGYLNNTTYAANHASVFDQGKETGFTGLNMHGNLAIAGTLKIFGCNGSSASRC